MYLLFLVITVFLVNAQEGDEEPEFVSRFNWAGNVRFANSFYHEPKTVEELSEIVKSDELPIKIVGSGHSFNTIADTTGHLISLKNLNKMFGVNDTVTDHQKSHYVTVEGGITFAELNPQLDEAGYALVALPSLPHVTIAGAIATGTHGSGRHIPTLAAVVKKFWFMGEDGIEWPSEVSTDPPEASDLSEYPKWQRNKRKETQFKNRCCAIHLGATGIVTKMELWVVPRYKIKQCVYENMHVGTLLATGGFDNVFSSAYSLSLFTDWQSLTTFKQVWVKNKLQDHDSYDCDHLFQGATLAKGGVHMIEGVDPAATTTNTPVGAWYEKLPHFLADHKPSAGYELQSEYFVPLEKAHDALRLLLTLPWIKYQEQLLVTEVRFVAADVIPLSPCQNRECVAFHFTWSNDLDAVNPILEMVEDALVQFNARPHWGKVTFRQEWKWRSDQLASIAIHEHHAHRKGRFLNDFLRDSIDPPSRREPLSDIEQHDRVERQRHAARFETGNTNQQQHTLRQRRDEL